MATIKDVASRAGVSTATVSYVLNGTGTVTAETRRRVMEAAAALDYQPNHAARSLRTRSHTIGLVLPALADRLADPALAEIVAGLAKAAAARGYYLLLASLGPDEQAQVLEVQLARSGRVDGLVLLDTRADDGRVGALWAAGVAAVYAGPELPELDGPHVALDLVGGARSAVQHLLALGHRRVALIALPSDLADSEPFYQGYVEALEAAMIEADPTLIVEAGASQDDGFAAMQELLGRPEAPTAVLAASDALAFGAMHALRDAGRDVGRDVSLVGCGDVPLAAHTHPPLTTLRVPRQALGRELAHRVIGLVEGGEGAATPPLPLQLIVRRSTSAPR